MDTKEKRWQRYLAQIKAFRLMDDDFMTKCFEDNTECVELMLKIILNKSDLKVIEAKTQVFILNLKNRSVRLDVLATDNEGQKYNIEIQRANSGAGFKRARYNSSMIDINMLQKNQDFANLPETYIIFITEQDVIERCNIDTTEIIDDGEHIIYVNGACQDDTPLGKLMQDMTNNDPATMNYSLLAKCVDYYKNSKEGNETMCKAMEDLWNEAAKETRKDAAFRMLAAGTLTLEQIAEFSGLTIEEVKQIQKEKAS